MVTRGEFDLLKQIVVTNQARLEGMDQSGTKGVAVVQTQLTDLVKDVVRLEAELDKRFDEHAHMHTAEAQSRTVSRRWAVSTFLAALAIIVTLLLNITIRLH